MRIDCVSHLSKLSHGNLRFANEIEHVITARAETYHVIRPLDILTSTKRQTTYYLQSGSAFK